VEQHQRGFAPIPIANVDVNAVGFDFHARRARRLVLVSV